MYNFIIHGYEPYSMDDNDRFSGSEIRRDYRTGRLSIIVPGRSKRPKEVKEDDLAGLDLAKCPFEPGNEHMSTEIMRSGNPWELRVIENKFPELSADTPLDGNISFLSEGKSKELLRYIGGYGYNEVVIESPLHNAVLEELSIEQLVKWLNILIEREGVLYTKRYIKHVFIFKNYGSEGGESIGHPHTQIMALPLVAGNVRKELKLAQKYENDNGSCLYEDIAEIEKTRMLTENDSFFAVAPFGSRISAESMIVPKRHMSYIGELSEKERRDFVSILAKVLSTNRKLYGKQAYNFAFHGIKDEPDFHMHVEIYPRMATAAGVELGEDIFVNTITPEDYSYKFRSLLV